MYIHRIVFENHILDFLPRLMKTSTILIKMKQNHYLLLIMNKKFTKKVMRSISKVNFATKLLFNA